MNKKEYKSQIKDLKTFVNNSQHQQRNPAGVQRAQQALAYHKSLKQAAKSGQITKAEKKEQRTKIFDQLQPKYNGAQRTDYLSY
jgi:hypothetical protein